MLKWALGEESPIMFLLLGFGWIFLGGPALLMWIMFEIDYVLLRFMTVGILMISIPAYFYYKENKDD